MIKTWFAALACAGFLSGAGPQIVDRTAAGPEIVNTPASPVVIEEATLGLDEQATSVVTLKVRASEPVGSFTARVRIYGSPTDKKPQGVVSRVLGPVGLETRTFDVPLNEWFIENQHIRVSVGDAQLAGEKEAFCGSGFCVNERTMCRQDCGPGCIARFICKLGRDACESDCQCKTTAGC